MSGDDQPSLTQAGTAPKSGYRAAGGTTTMAAVALVAALTSAFWSPPLFKLLHLRTPGAAADARQDVDIGRLNQSVADLERKLADVNTNLAKAQQDTASARAGQTAAESRVGLLALVQLQAALRRPGPFDVELALVRAANRDLGPLAAALEPLDKLAPSGILVGSQLRTEFNELADELTRRDYKVIPIAWMNSLLGRPTPGVEPAGVFPPVERASVLADRVKEKLANNDLAAAVNELASMSGDAAALVEPWVNEVRARIAADAAIVKLGDRIAATLSRP